MVGSLGDGERESSYELEIFVTFFVNPNVTSLERAGGFVERCRGVMEGDSDHDDIRNVLPG